MDKNKKYTYTGIPRGYFHGHGCRLTDEKLSTCQMKCSKFRKFVLYLTAVHPGDIRARNMYRSYAALSSEKCRQYTYFPASIHPFSKLRVWLEVVFVVTMLLSNTVAPAHYSKKNPVEQRLDIIMVYIFDLLYLLNVITNFFTGYIEGQSFKYTVLNLKKITLNYAKTWLIVDLLSCVCSLTGLFNIKESTPHLILVSMKILRLPILMKYTDNILTVLEVGVKKRITIEVFLLIISYVTWNMYFQFALEYIIEGSFNPMNPRNCSWMSIGKLWNNTDAIRFTYALERAVSMLRKNSNWFIMEEQQCFENFFVNSWVIAQLLVFHCAIKYIIALFGLESASAKYYIMIKQLENYMTQRRFPLKIKKKILKFYAIRFQGNFFAESSMLACVTGQLHEDIIMHTGRQLVSELECLKQLPRALLLQISLKLRVDIFITGDIIFKINTLGDCLYIIYKGTVAIYSESGKEICHLEDGDLFGEIALVMKHQFRTATAVAVTNCELFRLNKQDFDSSISRYPTVYEDIKKVATDRFERTCLLDEHHKTEIRMSNLKKAIPDL